MAAPHVNGAASEAKRALRGRMRERRAGLDPALGGRLRVDPSMRGVVAGFWPLPGEIDIRGLLHALAAGGRVVALPCIDGSGPLLFRRWWPGSALRPGPFGTSEPVGEVVVPQTVLVPLLAFDRRGGRLGYGGGYYDRTLRASRAFALGCGFADLEVDDVPQDAWDLRLDAVVTEDGVMAMEKSVV